jgi:hypothetical protein
VCVCETVRKRERERENLYAGEHGGGDCVEEPSLKEMGAAARRGLGEEKVKWRLGFMREKMSFYT